MLTNNKRGVNHHANHRFAIIQKYLLRGGRQIFVMSIAQKIFAGEDDMGLGGNDGSVATGNAGA